MKRWVRFLLILMFFPVSGFPETGLSGKIPEAVLNRAVEKGLDLYRRIVSELNANTAPIGAETWLGVRGSDPLRPEIYGGIAVRTPGLEGSLSAGLQEPGTINRVVPGASLSIPLLDGYPGGKGRRLEEERAVALEHARIRAIREFRSRAASMLSVLGELIEALNDREIAEASFESALPAVEQDELLPDSVSPRTRGVHADDLLRSRSALSVAENRLAGAEREWSILSATLGIGGDGGLPDDLFPDIDEVFSSPAGFRIPALLDDDPRRLELDLALKELNRTRAFITAARSPTVKLGMDVHGIVRNDGSLQPFFGLELRASGNFSPGRDEPEGAEAAWVREAEALSAELEAIGRETTDREKASPLRLRQREIAFSQAAAVRADGLEDARMRPPETRIDGVRLKGRTAQWDSSLRQAWLELVRAYFERYGIIF